MTMTEADGFSGADYWPDGDGRGNLLPPDPARR